MGDGTFNTHTHTHPLAVGTPLQGFTGRPEWSRVHTVRGFRQAVQTVCLQGWASKQALPVQDKGLRAFPTPDERLSCDLGWPLPILSAFTDELESGAELTLP